MSTEPLHSASYRSSSDRLGITSDQRRLLRNALVSGSENGHGEFSRRQAIREFCSVSRVLVQSPEQVLISFKESLIDAANEAGLPYGPERSDLLARVVTVFIEELYGFRIRNSANGDEAHR